MTEVARDVFSRQKELYVVLTWKRQSSILKATGLSVHLKYSREVSLNHCSFSWILNVLIIHEFLTAGYLGFRKTVPVSRGSYSMPKLREYVHNKTETLSRIASHF